MGLLDALAKSPLEEPREAASMLFYGKESFHVEHHPRSRLNQWRSWLEARCFGIVVLGHARPGELESELVRRLDQCAFDGVGRLTRVDIRLGDRLIELKSSGASELRSEQHSPNEATDIIVQMLDQARGATTPWEQFVLLIFPEVIKTWNLDRVIDEAMRSQANPKASLPDAMAPELLARYEKARQKAVEEFGLLRSEQLARAIHSTAGNVSLVASKWRRNGEIFAVPYGGKPGYFTFQFDPLTGRPKPAIARIIQSFPSDTEGWRLALWLTSANARLANRRPVDLLDRNPDQVIEAAKNENEVELF